MKRLIASAWLVFGLVTAIGAAARSDVRDGNAFVEPVRNARYSIDGTTMGKAELFGYISDLKDREHLTGIVLKHGGDDAQRHVIGSIARTLQLKAFEQEGRNLKSIDLPPKEPEPSAPPVKDPPPASSDSH
ncbi:MAG: hypothetical protein LBQ20_02820 [Rhodanobacter sp.]|jgi:hypothetical protein|nr:hypothetical protein [Rhodanobacter sp.]